jgi:phosphate starvation-inducible PhoH-like protein
VVRHRLVAEIVDAYSRYDEAQEQESTQSVRAVPGRAAGGGRAGRRR